MSAHHARGYTARMGSMRWWVLAALSAVIAVFAVLALKGRVRPSATQQTVSAAPDAAAACPDRNAVPGRVLATADAAPVVLLGDLDVHIAVDGSIALGSLEKPLRLEAGSHTFKASAEGLRDVELALTVKPFTPVFIEARKDGPAVTLLPLGAECTPCGHAVSLDVDPSGDVKASALDDAASALTVGDWKNASNALRAAPPKQRATPRFARLWAIIQAYGGESTGARDTLARNTTAETRGWLKAFDTLEAPETARRQEVAVNRWNAITERYSRFDTQFSADAASAVGNASARINALSVAFAQATKDKDVIGQESAIDSAEEVLRAAVRELRALKPTDCTWQARITAAM